MAIATGINKNFTMSSYGLLDPIFSKLIPNASKPQTQYFTKTTYNAKINGVLITGATAMNAYTSFCSGND